MGFGCAANLFQRHCLFTRRSSFSHLSISRVLVSRVTGGMGTLYAALIFNMFAGLLDQQIVYSSHPFIVVEGENVCGAFALQEEAEGFISKKASYSAGIYTHLGSKWVMVRGPRINPLLGPAAKRRKVFGNG